MADERELFKGTAEYYAKYRKGYPSEFFKFLRKEFALDGTGRLLDLGCGTGQIAIPLADDFDEVLALDPDADMLSEGERIAKGKGIANIVWKAGKAEEIDASYGSFRLATMGASFHWMDQAKVLETLYERLEGGGGLVLVYDSGASVGWYSNETPMWKQVQRDVIKKYLGEKRRAGNSFYKEPDKDFEDYLSESAFGGYEEWEHEFVQKWTIEEIVGFVHSTSFAASRLFGDRLAEFDAELRAELLKLEPSGAFTENAAIEALFARKR